MSAILATCAFSASPVAADPPPDDPDATGAVCSYNLGTGEFTCYPDDDAFATASTGGAVSRVAWHPGSHPSQRQISRLDAASRAGTVVVAIVYSGQLITGDQLIIQAPSGCDNNPDWDWAWSQITAWFDNRITSGYTYSNCTMKIWDYAGYGGASEVLPGPATGFDLYSDAMDNRTTSFKMK